MKLHLRNYRPSTLNFLFFVILWSYDPDASTVSSDSSYKRGYINDSGNLAGSQNQCSVTPSFSRTGLKIALNFTKPKLDITDAPGLDMTGAPSLSRIW